MYDYVLLCITMYYYVLLCITMCYYVLLCVTMDNYVLLFITTMPTALVTPILKPSKFFFTKKQCMTSLSHLRTDRLRAVVARPSLRARAHVWQGAVAVVLAAGGTHRLRTVIACPSLLISAQKCRQCSLFKFYLSTVSTFRVCERQT